MSFTPTIGVPTFKGLPWTVGDRPWTGSKRGFERKGVGLDVFGY